MVFSAQLKQILLRTPLLDGALFRPMVQPKTVRVRGTGLVWGCAAFGRFGILPRLVSMTMEEVEARKERLPQQLGET